MDDARGYFAAVAMALDRFVADLAAAGVVTEGAISVARDDAVALRLTVRPGLAWHPTNAGVAPAEPEAQRPEAPPAEPEWTALRDVAIRGTHGAAGKLRDLADKWGVDRSHVARRYGVVARGASGGRS